MPWADIELNDGRKLKQIGFGVWKVPLDETDQQVIQAVETGFTHIDTAQAYRNEQGVGKALKGFDREKLWVTTKYSFPDVKSIRESIEDSLNFLGIDSIDLYLLHSPRTAKGDIPGAWAIMEELQREGKAKSIGVSNFKIEHLEILLASAKVKPVVNQILYHPGVYATQNAIHEYGMKHGIVTEAYSLLLPLIQSPKSSLTGTINKIAERLNYTNDQVLMAWGREKGVVIVTNSSKKSRLEGYQKAGDIVLSKEDIDLITETGLTGN